MNPDKYKAIMDILQNETFAVRPKLLKYMEEVQVEEEKPKTRTSSQNSAIHKLFTDISNFCVETGIDQKALVTTLEHYSVPTTPQLIKELWRSIQISATGKESTTELETKEVDQVYDIFNKFISEVTGEHFPFPSVQSLIDSQRTE